jgi:hypothetical protein
MLQLTTTINFPASTSDVWAVLTDFAAYPDWNPFITQASGNWVEGNTVAVTAGGMRFQPKVLNFSAGKELRWKGKLLFNGILDGEHYFLLSANGDGTTLLEHGERFSGLLVPAFRKKLEVETKAGFLAMNEALRERILQVKAGDAAS